ncbi:MAG: glutamate-1-semialdehyde 2,1-aminomutase [Bacillota bacterium]
MRIVNFTMSKELQKKSHNLIPAGAHTYSKADDQFPELSPGFIVRGKGAYVWDLDGNQYIDWGMGLRSVILGHAYEPVLQAVREQLELGSNFTRPSPVEVELAELLVDTIPCAEMVKYAKNGSDVTAAAVRLARAYTGRKYIAICREHPFFSFYDWFIGSTPVDAGIPEDIKQLTVKFGYNDIASLEELFQSYPGQIAAVILEPVQADPPKDNFLQRVRQLCDQSGTVMILDEMITGFRMDIQGAQRMFEVKPDLATFGKAIANGFSLAVLTGKKEIMELGGIYHDKPKVFLLSATNGAETHSLAAGVATINELKRHNVPLHIAGIGQKLIDGINAIAGSMSLGQYIRAYGYPCSPVLEFKDQEGNVSLPFRTLFLQETITRGVMMPYVAISFAHGESELKNTLKAVEDAFKVYKNALDDGLDKHLKGRPVKPVFRKYN